MLQALYVSNGKKLFFPFSCGNEITMEAIILWN